MLGAARRLSSNIDTRGGYDTWRRRNVPSVHGLPGSGALSDRQDRRREDLLQGDSERSSSPGQCDKWCAISSATQRPDGTVRVSNGESTAA